MKDIYINTFWCVISLILWSFWSLSQFQRLYHVAVKYVYHKQVQLVDKICSVDIHFSHVMMQFLQLAFVYFLSPVLCDQLQHSPLLRHRMSHSPEMKDDPMECPLCMEPLEIDDVNFFPCTCGYQICRFCWHRIRTDENGLCPACRKVWRWRWLPLSARFSFKWVHHHQQVTDPAVWLVMPVKLPDWQLRPQLPHYPNTNALSQ